MIFLDNWDEEYTHEQQAEDEALVRSVMYGDTPRGGPAASAFERLAMALRAAAQRAHSPFRARLTVRKITNEEHEAIAASARQMRAAGVDPYDVASGEAEWPPEGES